MPVAVANSACEMPSRFRAAATCFPERSIFLDLLEESARTNSLLPITSWRSDD
jgi:hypothetical protein